MLRPLDPLFVLFYCLAVIVICFKKTLLRIMTGFLNAFWLYGFLALPSRRVFVFGSDENGGRAGKSTNFSRGATSRSVEFHHTRRQYKRFGAL